MNLGDTLRRNTLWVLTGDVGSRAGSLLFGIILARLLVPEDFGLVVTVQIITGALGFVAAGGMSDALVRAKTIDERDIRTVFTAQLGTCALILLLLNLIAPYFAQWFNEPRLDPLLRVQALNFLIRPFMSVPNALLQRAMRFKAFSLLIFVSLTIAGLSSTVLALLGYGPWSLVIGGLIGGAVRTLVVMRVARWIPALAFDPGAARTLGVYGLKLSVIDIVRYGRVQTANALISHQLGAAQVGLYNKADSLAEIPYEVLSGSAYHTLFRTLASIQDDRDRCTYLFLRSITVVTFYALPFYVGLLFVAEPFIVILYGQNWAPAALPLQILSLAGLFRLIANLSRAVAAAHNRLGREIIIQLETWVILILGALIGLNWGLPGVAIGILPSFAHNGVRMYRLAGSVLDTGTKDLWRALKPVLLLNAILAAMLCALHLALVASGVGERSLVYLLIMVGAGAATYGSLFLYRPAPALSTESQRWHQQIAIILGRRHKTP